LIGNSGGGLHEPVFAGNEREYVIDCIETGYVSSVGTFVTRFEEELAYYVGASHAVAVVNGTSALHLALVAVGVKPGDEVIVPALSFVATASAVALAGAIPHFVDVSYETWGIDSVELREYLSSLLRRDGKRFINRENGRPVTAIVPMHTLGHPCDGEGIKALAEEFGLAFVEDAAESLGSFSGGRHTGLAGIAGVFSFNGNKTITTGGGGAIVTNDSEIAARLKHLSTTAKIPHRFEFDHDAVGYNYRMPNINAALGVAQLEQLPGLVERQRSLHRKYKEALGDLTIGRLRSETPGTTSNYWLQAFLLKSELASQRDHILGSCLDAGIPVRPLWKPLNTLTPYRDSPSAQTPVVAELYSRVVCLPSSASLSL
jgi:aminotransferase in exopolysaccharide biosynthesis